MNCRNKIFARKLFNRYGVSFFNKIQVALDKTLIY